jgi:hypothetical protein
MGTTYHYANLTRREWFSTSAFGGSGKLNGLGLTLTGRTFELLLVGGHGRSAESDPVDFGRWAGDAIEIIGDNDDRWLQCNEQFTDLYADLIPFIHHFDGFEQLGQAATRDRRLYVQICHLIVTRQALELESGMKKTFGANYWARYKELYPTLHAFEQPKDLHWPRNRN